MADRFSDDSRQRALIGAGIAAAAAAGAATFLLAKRTADMRSGGETISDAPDHVLRGKAKEDPALVGRTVTINSEARKLYDAWRDVSRFPEFMENVVAVEVLDDKRSRWTVKAPAGTQVELVVRRTEDRPGELLAWESEPESQIATSGRVEFFSAGPARGTSVRLTMTYDPPGGTIGRGIAKLFQREPNIQARRDLRRFKQLMETGEITTNAGPSGRGEPVTEPKI
ncbi:MAG TPA: SRPBCC family protein [Sphingomicrobium sp.]|nr:SRPBCC family protein [Sphingomicrobium sp.]